jgi:hypothetical protein
MYDRDDDMYDQMQAEGWEAEQSLKHQWDEELDAEAKAEAEREAESQAEYEAEIADQEEND